MRRLRHREASDFLSLVIEPGNGLKPRLSVSRGQTPATVPYTRHCPLLPAAVSYSPVETAIEGQAGEGEGSPRERRKPIIREGGTDCSPLEAVFWGVGTCCRVS